MIDVYRFVLALCVLQAHFLAIGPLWLSWQAVFSFYVLSGFLMTLILNEDYGFAWSGFFRFAANRALRLLPIYYIVIGATAFYIVLIGSLDQLDGAITLPDTIGSWFENLSLLGLTGFQYSALHRLSPPAWSLTVEVCCYAVLGLYAAKSRARLLVMLAVGVVVTVVQIVSAFDQPNLGFSFHYRVIQAGLIPFSLGGLACSYRESSWFTFSRTKFAILAGLLLANGLFGYVSEFHKYVSGLYVAMLLNAAFVPVLFQRPAMQRWQKTLGGMAYPIFLSNWAIGTVLFLHFPAMESRGVAHFIATAIATMLFSLLMYYGVDRQVQRIRTRIKAGTFRGYFHRRPSPETAPASLPVGAASADCCSANSSSA